MNFRTAVTIFLLAFGWASTAFSQQTPRLRAGEHPNYSRVVVPVPEAGNWEFTVSGRSARIVVPGNTVGFDTSTVFDRIPKTRILSVSEKVEGDKTVIDFRFACDCEATATVSGQNVLVDVIDPNTESARAVGDATANEQDDQENTIVAEQLPEETPKKENENSGALEEQPEIEVTGEPATSLTEEPPEPPGSEVTSDVAARLVEQLEKAADQGYVDLKPPSVSQTSGSDPTEPNPAPQASMLPPYEENIDGMEQFAARLQREVEATVGSNLEDSVRLELPEETRNSLAPLQFPSNPQSGENESEPEHCLDDEYYDVNVLDISKAPISQIIDLRSRLVGEFDQPDTAVADELSRLYIALGMGAEARSVINAFLPDEPNSVLLLELTDLVEDRTTKVGGVLDKSASCPGPAAMWRTAAFPDAETQPLAQTSSIVTQLSSLPVELRRHVVPKVVASLINRGQIEAAEASFAVLDRASGIHGSAHEFQRAHLLSIRDEPSMAEAIWAQLAKQADPIAPKALMALSDSQMERHQSISPMLIGDLEAMARQFRSTPLSLELRRTEILARAGNGRFYDALKVLSRELEENPEVTADYLAVADALFTEARSEDVKAGQYAKTIFENMDILLTDAISGDARLSVARELISIGLPQTAIKILENLVADIDEKGRQPNRQKQISMKLAHAWISLDQPERALQTMVGLSGAEFDDLRVRAFAMLGQYGDAITNVTTNVADLEFENLGWLAGRWDLVGDSSETKDAFARYMLRREDNPPTTDPNFSSAELLVFESLESEVDIITLMYARDMADRSASVRKAINLAINE